MTTTRSTPQWTTAYAPGVPAEIDPITSTVVDNLRRAATNHPNRVAVDFLGASRRYRQLEDDVLRAAAALRAHGVRAGDRVAIALPNCTQHVVAFHAVLRLGAVVVEVNPTYTAAELAHQLADSGAVMAVVWEQVATPLSTVRDDTAVRTVVAVNMAADLRWVSRTALSLPVRKARQLRTQLRGPVPAGVLRWEDVVAGHDRLPDDHPGPTLDDPALIQYTGGTTGVPKGAVLTHRNLSANIEQGLAWTQLEEGTETVYAALPFFHAFGLTLCLTFAVRLGATLVAFPKFDTHMVLAAQRRRPATFFPGVPPMFERLAAAAIKTGADLTSIRRSFSGAMPLPRSTADRWEELTGGVLVEGYGMTESSPVSVGNPLSERRRPGTLGVPFPSTQVRIVDPEDPTTVRGTGERGELLVSGPQVFSGYWQRPEESATSLIEMDGRTWLRTGDIVVMDDTGFVTLVDRCKEIIISGGFNIYPSQVEDHLRDMPGVADVAVVGLPGSDLGEKVVAAVVLDAAGPDVDLGAVRAWCEQKLARYALPKELVVLPDLPRSQIGKVLRRVVRENLMSGGDHDADDAPGDRRDGGATAPEDATTPGDDQAPEASAQH